MRRETVVLAMLSVALSAGCQGSPSGVVKEKGSAPPAARLDPRGDAVSGCPEGSSLVKAVITLSAGGVRGCRAEVSPAHVCVFQGGVILWKVSNSCDALPGTRALPALRVTRPKLPAAAVDARKAAPGGTRVAADASSILAYCEPQVDAVATGDTYLFCGISDAAAEGTYKYGLEGEGIDPLDPDIEVRRGN